MGNGESSMQNGRWKMDNYNFVVGGKWIIECRKWKMDNGKRVLVNGGWKMANAMVNGGSGMGNGQ